MTAPLTEPNRVRDVELASMKQNLGFLRAQADEDRVDTGFLIRQLDRMAALLTRIEQERSSEVQKVPSSLHALALQLGSSLDLQAVLHQVMDTIIQLSGAERGFLMLRDDDGQVSVRVARNVDQQTIDSTQFQYSRGVTYNVLDTGQAVMTTNAAEDPRFSAHASIVNQNLRSILALPLRVRGTVMGVIYADTRQIADFMSDDLLHTLEAYVAQAAIAIDNAKLFSSTDQELQSRVDELQQLRRIDLLLNETLDPAKAMQITLNYVCLLTHADVGHLGLMDGERLPASFHYGMPQDDTQPLYLDRSFAQVVTAMGNQQTTITTVSGDSVMVVPIQREQKPIGAVVLRKHGAFSDSERDLAERVIGRSAITIENARLYAAVQKADIAKSEFVGVVAHDLKVPMTSILGYADLALLDELPPHVTTYLKRIRDTVRRMESLVSDLADISRIESGHFSMALARVPVNRIVEGVREAIMTQMTARNHTWTEEIDPDLPDLNTDYFRLLQVLTNLVSNAYKYTPDGGTITFSVSRDSARPNRVAFTVRDTGIGLSPEAVRQLGTKFWRAEDDFTRSQPGTGLGFAITRSLVEQMGSTIRIDSAQGRGSAFTFSVPVFDGDAS
jgi:signal transduction histidine kinase